MTSMSGPEPGTERGTESGTMRAVVYDAYEQLPTVREVPAPGAPDGGVVLDVAATGVCRSDWHAWMGHDPVDLPHVPGHELVGTIEALGAGAGAGVGQWRVGDRVCALLGGGGYADGPPGMGYPPPP